MDPAQTPPPPPPVANIENTPPPPPAPPVDVAPPPPATPMPPPPPPPGIITEKPKVKWGAGKIVGALVVLVVLVGGLAAGIYLSQRNQSITPSQAAGTVEINGTGCEGNSTDGINCRTFDDPTKSVYKFVCNGATGQCGNDQGVPISEDGPTNFLEAGPGTPCNQTVQIDVFDKPTCRDSGGAWDTKCVNTGNAIWYTGACPVNVTPTTPPSSGGSLTVASCDQGISGSGLANDVTQVHLYFDSGPEDYTDNGGDGSAAAKVITPINNAFNYSLLDNNNLLIAKQIGGNVNLGDGQAHRVRAFAINGSTNPELAGSNMEIDLHGRILGRIHTSNGTFQNDPNKIITKCTNCSYNNALCDNAPALAKNITIDGTNVQTVNKCNTGGPNYDTDLPMGTHSLVLSSGSNESVGWDCSSDNGVGCPAASGTGYTVTTTAATCAPIHVSYYVAGAAIATPIPTLPAGVAQCQTVSVFSITRGGTAVASPTLAKIQKGDVVVFRGFATATNTTVDTIDFTLTKAGVAQAAVQVTPTLVSGTYHADYQITIDQATSYSVSSSPTYN